MGVWTMKTFLAYNNGVNIQVVEFSHPDKCYSLKILKINSIE